MESHSQDALCFQSWQFGMLVTSSLHEPLDAGSGERRTALDRAPWRIEVLIHLLCVSQNLFRSAMKFLRNLTLNISSIQYKPHLACLKSSCITRIKWAQLTDGMLNGVTMHRQDQSCQSCVKGHDCCLLLGHLFLFQGMVTLGDSTLQSY